MQVYILYNESDQNDKKWERLLQSSFMHCIYENVNFDGLSLVITEFQPFSFRKTGKLNRKILIKNQFWINNSYKISHPLLIFCLQSVSS